MITRDLKQTVAVRTAADPVFARALFDEVLTLFLNSEPGTAKLVGVHVW